MSEETSHLLRCELEAARKELETAKGLLREVADKVRWSNYMAYIGVDLAKRISAFTTPRKPDKTSN